MKTETKRSTKHSPDADNLGDERARDQILDCAIKEFSKKGFGGANIRNIADSAGVSHSMIKYYFGGKDALWRDAVNFLFSRQAQEMAPALAAIASGDSPASMATVIEHIIRYSATHPEHARLVMQASMTPGPHLDWVLKHLREEAGYSYQKPTGHESETERKAREGAVATHYLVYGACHAIFMLEHEARGLYDIDVSQPEFIDSFVALAQQLLAPAAQSGAVSEDYAKHLSTAIHNPAGIQTRETEDGLELRMVIPKSLLPNAKG